MRIAHHHLVLRSIAFSATVLATRAFAQTPQGPARTDVPVRTVILYSSGVGYFEHAGTVRGTGATEIRFKTDQINDVLKSLVLQDQAGGRVTAITYPSRDPVSKALKSFQIDITGNPTFADLLNQVRGARVTAQVGAERITGAVLGIELRRKVKDKDDVYTPVLNILSGGTIRSFDLASVQALTLDDPKLQDELIRALAALSQARDQDKKPVTINFSGTGERRLRIGYVVETPIWKTSYRLILDGPSARLQGWAIVENQTESDWNDVSLSLVSGRPISFSQDLYQPLYASRPKVTPEQFAGLRPQSYAGGIDSVAFAGRARSFGSGAANGPITITAQAEASRRVAIGNSVASLAAAPLSLSEVVVTGSVENESWADSTVQSRADAARMGELFQYTVPNVTLARQKSAMLPIVVDSVGVDRLSIYNASVLATNPLNGIRLRNVTGKHLLQGPITVLDADRYAGDARIDDIPAGQDRLLSYGVDLDVLVDNTKDHDSSMVVTARIVKGLLTVERRNLSWQEYLIDNKGDREKTVVIEHPVERGWKLFDTPRPKETTRGVYRFEQVVAGKKSATLVVKTQSMRSESVRMGYADTTALLSYARIGEIPAPVRDALARAVQLKRSVIDTERQIAARTSEIAQITAEQNRIRDNMKTVATGTAYYKRLLEKLNEQESSIERLQRERTDLSARRDAQRKELDDYIAGLNVGA